MSNFVNWIADKVCNRCGVGKEFYPSINQPCKACWKAHQREWANKIDPVTGITNKKRTELRRRHKSLPRMKQYRDASRRQVLFHYSNGTMSCKCCRESEPKFLALDHIEPVGRGIKGKTKSGQHRGGISLYRYLIDNCFPEGYRVLCHNCNLGRSLNGGICPHEQELKRAIGL